LCHFIFDIYIKIFKLKLVTTNNVANVSELEFQAISKESMKYREVIKKIGKEADLILLELSNVDQELITAKVKGMENRFNR